LNHPSSHPVKKSTEIHPSMSQRFFFYFVQKTKVGSFGRSILSEQFKKKNKMNKTLILLIALVFFAAAFVSAEEVNTQGLGSAFKRFTRGVRRAADRVASKAKKAASSVKKAANKVKAGVKKAANKVKEGIKKAVSKFRPNITTYPRATSLNPLLFAAHLSHAAYKDAYVYNTDQKIYLDDSTLVSTIDTTAKKQRIITKIVSNDRLKLIGVGIRGTQTKEFQDIIANLKFLKVKCSLKNAAGQNVDCGKVHQGFWQDVVQQFEKIRDAVKPFVEKGYSLMVTGHSQGAAESTIVALYLKLQFPTANLIAYNFGSPRVGDKKFVSVVNKYLPNLTRFVERSQGILRTADPVSTVPPKFTFYKHAGTQVNLSCKYKLSLKCHSVTNYIASVGGVAMPDSEADKIQGAQAKSAQAATKKATATKKGKTSTKKTSTKKGKAAKRSSSKKGTKRGGNKKRAAKKGTKKGKRGCRKAPKWVKLQAGECFVGMTKPKKNKK